MAKQLSVRGYLTETDYMGNKIGESKLLVLDTSGKNVQVPSALETYFENYIKKSKNKRFIGKSVDVEGDSYLKDSAGKKGIFYVEIFVKGQKGEERVMNSVYFCYETESFVKSQYLSGIPTYTSSSGNIDVSLLSNVG